MRIMPKIAIVIPAHNEEKRIDITLKEYTSFFSDLMKKKKDIIIRIIVVLNACKDKTPIIVKKYRSKYLESIEFERGGKGFAVIGGFKRALSGNYDYIGFVDADMATRPEEFYRLFNKILQNDGVIASRYLKGAKLHPKNTLARILASRFYNIFMRALLIMPYRDTQCGAKIFKRKAVEDVVDKIGMTSWAFDIELLYVMNKNNYKIKEEPTVWSNKDNSKINFWNSGIWMGFAILRLRILNSPLKKMIRFYDKFIKLFKPSK